MTSRHCILLLPSNYSARKYFQKLRGPLICSERLFPIAYWITVLSMHTLLIAYLGRSLQCTSQPFVMNHSDHQFSEIRTDSKVPVPEATNSGIPIRIHKGEYITTEVLPHLNPITLQDCPVSVPNDTNAL